MFSEFNNLSPIGLFSAAFNFSLQTVRAIGFAWHFGTRSRRQLIAFEFRKLQNKNRKSYFLFIRLYHFLRFVFLSGVVRYVYNIYFLQDKWDEGYLRSSLILVNYFPSLLSSNGFHHLNMSYQYDKHSIDNLWTKNLASLGNVQTIT